MVTGQPDHAGPVRRKRPAPRDTLALITGGLKSVPGESAAEHGREQLRALGFNV